MKKIIFIIALLIAGLVYLSQADIKPEVNKVVKPLEVSPIKQTVPSQNN